MKTSKICSLLFTLFFVFLFMTHAVYAYTEVNIDGKPVAFTEGTGYPYVESGRTLVPLRITMESFGADVSWDNGTKTAFVVKGPVTVRCSVGENSIYRNNVKIPNDASAVIKDGRTYLPIRAVLEAFGAEVGWDGSVKVASLAGESVVDKALNTPSVTNNYWGVWNKALELKKSGDYKGAVSTIMSISKVFLEDNKSASCAMLFKHLGECYSHMGEYDSASRCFSKEADYWSVTEGQEQSRIDAERRAKLIGTNIQMYIKNTDKAYGGRIDFGTYLEPSGGVLLGAYAEGDKNLHDPYNPDKFYMDTFPVSAGKDAAGYLIYLPYGESITKYNSHIRRAAEKGKFLQVSLEPHGGLSQVNGEDGYLITLAREMENSACPLMLRFAGEMNEVSADWYGEPSVYIEKFRLVADIFHEYAPNVPVIWAPNFYPEDTMDDYYPGDEYVDYVGISSYQGHQPVTDPLGQGVDRSRWSSQLDRLYSLYSHKKPIIIVEGAASYTDNNGKDITEYACRQIKDFLTYLPIKYPNVKMFFANVSDSPRKKYALTNNTVYHEAFSKALSGELILSDAADTEYSYGYTEIGNNVPVRAEKTQLCAYVTTPSQDVAYVNYYIDGEKVGVSYGIPFAVDVDLTAFSGKNVTVEAKAFSKDHKKMTESKVRINVE